jgi:hypothetical protein
VAGARPGQITVRPAHPRDPHGPDCIGVASGLCAARLDAQFQIVSVHSIDVLRAAPGRLGGCIVPGDLGVHPVGKRGRKIPRRVPRANANRQVPREINRPIPANLVGR